jgi:hypothetical protein
MAANIDFETVLLHKFFGVKGEGGIHVYMCEETRQATVILTSFDGRVLYINEGIVNKLFSTVTELCKAGPNVKWAWAAWFATKQTDLPVVFRIKKDTLPDKKFE